MAKTAKTGNNKVMKKIRKDNGTTQDYNPQKFHEKVFFALEGLNTLSASEIEMQAAPMIVDGSTSKDIQKALVEATADMISEDLPEAEIAAARLLNQSIRKEVYGKYEVPTLLETVKKNISEKIYDGKYLFDHYTEAEVQKFGEYIKYDRDDKFVYSGLKKTKDSYLVKKYGKLHETPQEMFMMINMFAFAKYEGKEREKWVKEGYNILSNFEASLPTPIMIQLRTMFRRFVSCNLIPYGDSKETIANSAKSMLTLVAGGAGLGIGTGDIRGLDADIDNGRIKHTGLQPILKAAEKSSKAFVQPDRDGSCTAYYPFYHVEIEHIMVMGNNKGTEDTRVRDIDHAIIFNDLFFERYAKDEDITLFFMNDVKDLQSYNGYSKEFKEKYEHYERTVPKRKQKKVSAKKIFNRFLDEQFLQSREYCLFADEFQSHSSFDIPLKISNLCVKGDTSINIKYNDTYSVIRIDELQSYLNKFDVQVLSRNIDTAVNEYKIIEDFAMTNPCAELLKITDENSGNYIECTLEHKVWTENRGYVEAQHLVHDDVLNIL